MVPELDTEIEVLTNPAGDAVPSRPHRLRNILLIVVGVIAVFLGVAVGSFLSRAQPGARSIRSAAQAFDATTTTVPTPRVFALPPAGVYRATGAGFEQIAVPPDTIHDSTVMPVSVSYLPGGCWRWHLDYSTAHWHEYDFCPHDGRLLLQNQQNSLTWDFGLTSVTNLARFACDPPSPIVVESPQPGEVFAHRCTGTNSAASGTSSAAGPVTIVGVRGVRVGTRTVQSIEMTRHQTISGGQSGTLDETWWFATSTGMPLQESRNYHLTTSSPIGDIAYTEIGSWHLDSMVPAVSGKQVP